MINAAFFMGLPQPFQNICKVYPPKIKEIMEEPNYPLYQKIILISGEEIEDEFIEDEHSFLNYNFEQLPSPLEYIF
jgi:hypothetical protein